MFDLNRGEVFFIHLSKILCLTHLFYQYEMSHYVQSLIDAIEIDSVYNQRDDIEL